jgi:hypothetical protein
VPFGGCEASRTLIFDEEVTALIHVLLNITHCKLFLPGDAYPLEESSCPLGVYSWLSYVRRRWDGLHTRVHTDSHAWVPTAMSLRVRCLSPPLLEAQSRRCLSVARIPRARLIGGLGPFPGSSREAGGADRWRNPVCPC